MLSSRTGYYTVIIARTDKPIRTSGLYGLTKCLGDLVSSLYHHKVVYGPTAGRRLAANMRFAHQAHYGPEPRLKASDDLRTYRRS